PSWSCGMPRCGRARSVSSRRRASRSWRSGTPRWTSWPHAPSRPAASGVSTRVCRIASRSTNLYRLPSATFRALHRRVRGRRPRTLTGAGFTNTSTESGPIVTRTFSPKPADIQRDWVVIDATDVVLGRLASHAAALLRGKHKPTFAPHVDMGDFVIVVNAEKVALTGQKLEKKLAYRHSGYPGGLTATTYVEMLEKHPTRAVEKAIRGMLPKNS